MRFRKLGKLNFENQPLLLIAAGMAFTLAITTHAKYKRPEISVTKQQSALNINTMLLKFLAIGNKRLISDVLWIQTLIESDLEVYKGDPFNNWMYLRFKSIAMLDPLFYENYLFGGMFLSIVKDDVEGAEEIMGKGLKHYPDDYRLNFNQGFNYYFEMGNAEKGLVHLEKVQYHPKAPKYLTSLLIKLKHSLSNDPDLTISMLKEAHDSTEDQTLKNKLASDIYSIKATRDLECLNGKRGNCETKDAYGDSYILKESTYQAIKPFSPYKLHRTTK